jgi:hypothetical protein
MGKMSASMMWTVGGAAAGSLVALAALALLSGPQNNQVRPAIPSYGNIIQSGALAGWASGAKISADGSVAEFEQITHARQLAQRDEFEYGGLNMRISQVAQVSYAPASSGSAGRNALHDMTLLRVTAKIRLPR